MHVSIGCWKVPCRFGPARGGDAATGTVWEALDHQGRPCRQMPRRLRVQARQAYAFAKLAGHPETDPTLGEISRRAPNGFSGSSWREGLRSGQRQSCQCAVPDLDVLEAPHDLYDLSFRVSWRRPGCWPLAVMSGKTLQDSKMRCDRLEAPQGWFETANRSVPRRQNPHMHLFEAMCAMYRVTGAARFGHLAARCRAVLLGRFDAGRWPPA